MKNIITCLLCAVNLWIFIDNEGKCIEIRDGQTAYPCAQYIMIDTGCWDENLETELCGATFIVRDNNEQRSM